MNNNPSRDRSNYERSRLLPQSTQRGGAIRTTRLVRNNPIANHPYSRKEKSRPKQSDEDHVKEAVTDSSGNIRTLSLASITKSITKAFGDIWSFGKVNNSQSQSLQENNKPDTPHYVGESSRNRDSYYRYQDKEDRHINWKDSGPPIKFDLTKKKSAPIVIDPIQWNLADRVSVVEAYRQALAKKTNNFTTELDDEPIILGVKRKLSDGSQGEGQGKRRREVVLEDEPETDFASEVVEEEYVLDDIEKPETQELLSEVVEKEDDFQKMEIPNIQFKPKPVIDLKDIPKERTQKPGYFSADFDFSDEDDEEEKEKDSVKEGNEKINGSIKPSIFLNSNSSPFVKKENKSFLLKRQSGEDPSIIARRKQLQEEKEKEEVKKKEKKEEKEKEETKNKSNSFASDSTVNDISPSKAKLPFSFGKESSSSDITNEKPKLSFGFGSGEEKKEEKKESSSNGISSVSFSFSTSKPEEKEKPTTNSAPTFSFSSSNPEEKDKPTTNSTPTFSFSSSKPEEKEKSTTNSTPTFSFSSSNSEEKDKPTTNSTPTFSFSSSKPEDKSTSKPTPLFSLGKTESTTPTLFFGQSKDEKKPETSSQPNSQPISATPSSLFNSAVTGKRKSDDKETVNKPFSFNPEKPKEPTGLFSNGIDSTSKSADSAPTTLFGDSNSATSKSTAPLFGTPKLSPDNEAAKPFSFGATATAIPAVSTTDNKPTFSATFGASSSATTNPSSANSLKPAVPLFGSTSTTSTTAPFSFGTTTTTTGDKSKETTPSPFSFSTTNTAPAVSTGDKSKETTPAPFSFGATTAASVSGDKSKESTPAPFTFGSKSKESTPTPFTFGTKSKESTPVESIPASKIPSTTTSGFSFGSTSNTGSNLFGAGTNATATTSAPATSNVFGTTAAPPVFGGSSTNSFSFGKPTDPIKPATPFSLGQPTSNTTTIPAPNSGGSFAFQSASTGFNGLPTTVSGTSQSTSSPFQFGSGNSQSMGNPVGAEPVGLNLSKTPSFNFTAGAPVGSTNGFAFGASSTAAFGANNAAGAAPATPFGASSSSGGMFSAGIAASNTPSHSPIPGRKIAAARPRRFYPKR